MAVLSDPVRAEVAADYHRTFELSETTGALKPEVRDLLNAADDWVDANAAAFNQAIPVGIRNKFTSRQKARALLWIVRRRFDFA